jgi:3-methyladenine DNA glycosylase AlkD
MGHDTLANHFNVNFTLMHVHKYNLDTLNAMVPWERYVYIDLLAQYIKAKEQEKTDIERQKKANKR